jgi:Protein of unknown function (DUF1569)
LSTDEYFFQNLDILKIMKTIRNEQDRANLVERLNKLSGDEERLWGKMTVNQMLSHLVQAGEMPFGHELKNQSNFMSRNIIKPLVLYVLPMPKEVKTTPDMNQQENGRKPEDFFADKAKVIDLAKKLASISENAECREHPFFGAMNAKEWGIIVHKHVDHHLKQFSL